MINVTCRIPVGVLFFIIGKCVDNIKTPLGGNYFLNYLGFKGRIKGCVDVQSDIIVIFVDYKGVKFRTQWIILNWRFGMKIDKEAPIGVFDSGVGGLTVAREIMKNLPMERIIYFGDTARVPYGNKSRETVQRYSRQIVRFLVAQGVKAIVVACNTASALALDEIEKELDIPIIGVVKPGARVAAESTVNRRVGVIATESTIQSGMYQECIHEINAGIQVVGKACPLFVPLVEEGWMEDEVTDMVARRYLEEFREQEIDSLILGCTHYPLLSSAVGRVMGAQVKLVNPAYETAHELQILLRGQGIENRCVPDAEFPYRFFVSDAAKKFTQFANSILPYDVRMTQQINIEEY